MTPQPGSTYVDADGAVHQLEVLIASGGEGTVWRIAGRPDEVAKLYKRIRPEADYAKLAALIRWISPEIEQVAAWPRRILFDPTGQPVGFVMRHIGRAKPVGTLINPAVRLEQWPEVSFAFLTRTAINLCILVEMVHATGALIGDLNDQNVLIDRTACATLLDIDSIQIPDGDTLYPCPVGMALFTAPELFGQELREQVRSVQTDSYALGVLIFQLLMTGRYPFAGVSTSQLDITPQEAAKQGFYAYSRSRIPGGLIPPPGAPPIGMLPDTLLELFERAFRLGTVRPGIAEWRLALEDLELSFVQCHYVQLHQYRGELEECPWCSLSASVGLSLFEDPSSSKTSVSAVPTGWTEATESGLLWTGKAYPETNAEWHRLKPQEAQRLLHAMQSQWTNEAPDIRLPGYVVPRPVVKTEQIDPRAVFLLVCLVPFGLEAFLRLSLGPYDASNGLEWLGEGLLTLLLIFRFYYDQLVRTQRQQVEWRWQDWQERWRATNPQANDLRLYQEALEAANKLIALTSELDAWEASEIVARQATIRQQQLWRYLKSLKLEEAMLPEALRGLVPRLSKAQITTAADVHPQALRRVEELEADAVTQLLDWVQQASAAFVAQPDPRLQQAIARERRERAYAEGNHLRTTLAELATLYADQWRAHLGARKSLESTRIPILKEYIDLDQGRALAERQGS